MGSRSRNGRTFGQVDWVRTQGILMAETESKLSWEHPYLSIIKWPPNDPLCEKLWITSKTVRKVTTALPADGIGNDVHSWDVLILKVLGHLPQSTSVSRTGVIARSDWHEGFGRLQWKYIKVKENVDGKGWAQIKLIYIKGLKTFQRKSFVYGISNPNSELVLCSVS